MNTPTVQFKCRLLSVDLLPQNTSLATRMNQSGLDDTNENFLSKKSVGVGVQSWVSPLKPVLYTVLGLQGQRGILNWEEGDGLHQVVEDVEFPTALSTLPRHVYITETSWKHTLFSLALWSQLVPESQAKSFPRITGILPSGLDQTEQNSHHSTCSGLSLFYLTWVHVCLLSTNILQPLALRMLSTKSPDLGLVWVERDWQEEWHHLAWNTFRVGKFSPSHLQTRFQCFMTHILYFHWGPAACKGKKKIQAQGFRSSILRILPTSP